MAMKFVQKSGSMLLKLIKPPEKRGLRRLDLIVFLSLGAIITANLLYHALQPSSALASSTKIASVQGAPANTHSPSAVPMNPLDPTAPTGFPGCHDNAGLEQPDKLKGPFGANDLLFFVTCPGLTTGQSIVSTLWEWARNIVNAFMVVLFILAGLRIMLGGSVLRYANAIEVLPAILLALVAANISLNIMSLSLDLNNGLVAEVYNRANDLQPTTAQFSEDSIETKTCNNWWTIGGGLLRGIPGALLGYSIGCNINPHVTNWNEQLQQSLDVPNPTGGLSFTGISYLFSSITNLLGFITGIIALMLVGQMIIRLFLLNFYIILAPLGIGAWAMPGRSGQALTRLWLQGFFATLFSQFLQVVGLIVIRLLTGVITSGIYAGFHDSAINGDATLLWIIQIAQFWFLLRIPTLIGATSTNMIISFGQTMSQLAQTAVMLTAMEVQFVSSIAISAASTGVAAAAAAAR
jgi:hypothetical protein